MAAKPAAKGGKNKGKGKDPNKLPLLKYPGDIGADKVTAPQMEDKPFDYTDTTFKYDQLNPDKITTQDVSTEDIYADEVTAGTVSAGKVKAGKLAERFMTAANYAMVDPRKIAGEFGDINRGETAKNADLSSELALKNLDTELQGLKNFAPAAAALKRTEIGKDNQFNQAERNAQLAAGDPNLRADLEGQRSRANAYAEGRVPDSIQDRALELGIRSRAADSAGTAGFGASSGAARKASELMSAEARIGLSQYGDQALTSNIRNRADLLLAPMQYSDAGAQLKVTPTQSAGQVALGIASEANAGNITAKDALSNLTQQEQFKTGIEQDTGKTNLLTSTERDLNQAKLDLTADTTNVQTDLQAQTTNVGNQLNASLANQSANLAASTTNAGNSLRAQEVNASNRLSADTSNVANSLSAQERNAANAISTQGTSMQIKSGEKQASAQLSWNTQNANSQRTFEASNINSSNALKVADSNRQTKLDVQKTNSNMIFQDLQQRKAEAAANARAAAAEAGANARAAMSAGAQKAALAATLAEHAADRQFQLQQQAAATAAYEKGVDRAQKAQDNATTGQLIARVPSIVAGVNTAVNLGTNIYNSLFGDGGSTPDIPSLDFSIPDFSFG